MYPNHVLLFSMKKLFSTLVIRWVTDALFNNESHYNKLFITAVKYGKR